MLQFFIEFAFLMILHFYFPLFWGDFVIALELKKTEAKIFMCFCSRPSIFFAWLITKFFNLVYYFVLKIKQQFLPPSFLSFPFSVFTYTFLEKDLKANYKISQKWKLKMFHKKYYFIFTHFWYKFFDIIFIFVWDFPPPSK